MTEPTEEEIEVVAKAMFERLWPGIWPNADWDDREGYRLDARAAILALDEHRAAEAPKHKDDF